MKARVIATGEIVEVKSKVITSPCTGNTILKYVDQKKGISYFKEDLDFDIEGKFTKNCLNGIKQGVDYNPDYWTRLEHQYAGMAMQGLMSYIKQITPEDGCSYCNTIVDFSFEVAHALVEKYKEKEANNG